MIKLNKAVAAFSLAAAAVILPCSTNCDLGGQAAYATNKHTAGETVCEEQMNGKTYVVARVIVKAPPEKVFQVLSDYDHADRVFPQIKHCKLVADKGASKIVAHKIAPAGVLSTYEYVLEIKETAPHALEWHRISGDFKQVDGFWKLEAADGGRSTDVTYACHIDGGIFIPQMLIRRQCKIDMTSVMSSLKATTEGASNLQIAGRPDRAVNHVQ